MNEIIVHEEWCKGCGICVSVCPKNVYTMGTKCPETTAIDKCIGCKLCEMCCPDFAIEVEVKK